MASTTVKMNLNERARISGTCVRLRYLETSVGNSAIDRLLGGGLPISAIYLIDEHYSRAFSQPLAKYFLAEGAIHGHDLFVASASKSPDEIIENLPEKIVDEQEKMENQSKSEQGGSSGNNAGDDETPEMRIAWRYANVPKMNSSISGGGGGGGNRRTNTQFDLTKTMDPKLLQSINIHKYPSTKIGSPQEISYKILWNQINTILQSNKYRSMTSSVAGSTTNSDHGAPSKANLLRILIDDFGSPMWQDSGMELKLLARLKAALNEQYIVLMITINSQTMNAQLRDRIYSYCDAGFLLETIEEGKSLTSTFGDHFDGYFRIVKLPSFASLGCNCPESSDLTFELHRRKFDVKILHLPPVSLDDDGGIGNNALPCQAMLDAF